MVIESKDISLPLDLTHSKLFTSANLPGQIVSFYVLG